MTQESAAVMDRAKGGENSLVGQIGGVPMIDREVDVSVAASLAAAMRRRLSGTSGEIAGFLDPVRAYQIYQDAYPELSPERKSCDLLGSQSDEVQAAREEILDVMPEWRLAFAIPIRWRFVSEPILSSTNPRVPQTIFLGIRSFEDSVTLQESIVHEMSHTWLGMIGEVSPLTNASSETYVLPSGTGNKEYWNLLYALCFAVSAIRYYQARARAGRAAPSEAARIDYLRGYSQGCIDQAEKEPEKLRAPGRDIVDSCKRFLAALEPAVRAAAENAA
jgi:hypothetical protein